jgi:hypothetical protein
MNRYRLSMVLVLILSVLPTLHLQAKRLHATGKITLLRVHELGTGFGPNTDFINVEVVCQLSSKPGQSFGFQLRNDNKLPARQGMFDLLRDAFNHNWTVHIEYDIDPGNDVSPGKKNGVIIRVWLTK